MAKRITSDQIRKVAEELGCRDVSFTPASKGQLRVQCGVPSGSTRTMLVDPQKSFSQKTLQKGLRL